MDAGWLHVLVLVLVHLHVQAHNSAPSLWRVERVAYSLCSGWQGLKTVFDEALRAVLRPAKTEAKKKGGCAIL